MALAPGSDVVHVVGARPNFVKAAPVLRALTERGVAQRLVHTGQHVEADMSAIFFADLDIPQPDLQLATDMAPVGRLGRLVRDLQQILESAAPALVVVYGDVDSTLGAALAARSLGLSVAHVEAGLRSFDLSMPEEFNRRVVDLASALLLVTSPEAVDNLIAEGVDATTIHLVGNPMIDTLLAQLDRLDPKRVRAKLDLPERYSVATIHRPANVDTAEGAQQVVRALKDVAQQVPVVLPLHPRGREGLNAAGLDQVPGLHVVLPLGYVDFVSLVRGAALVVTDSGGVQEETTMLGVPCLTLRENTERPITMSHGTNRLIRPDEAGPAAAEILGGRATFPAERPPLWDGRAGERIADVVQAWLAGRPATSSAINR